jgi:hypothetical protein
MTQLSPKHYLLSLLASLLPHSVCASDFFFAARDANALCGCFPVRQTQPGFDGRYAERKDQERVYAPRKTEL